MSKKKVKKHLWVTEEQDQKLRQLKETLGLNNGQVFRAVIDRDYLYINLYQSIKHELQKQGNNLNQIARYANTGKMIDSQILEEIVNLKEQQKKLLSTLLTIKE